MFIIGIAGGTGSGKTTVVKKLTERLPKGEVVVIPQDSYYKDSSNVPVEERQNINFDHPDAFEWPLLERHLRELREGKPIEQPIYSYLTCTRQAETIHIEPKEVVIIEGILTLVDKKLRAQMDLKIFVDADADDRLIRVIKRDIVERGRTTEGVIDRYQKVLKPMHEQFIQKIVHVVDFGTYEANSSKSTIYLNCTDGFYFDGVDTISHGPNRKPTTFTYSYGDDVLSLTDDQGKTTKYDKQ